MPKGKPKEPKKQIDRFKNAAKDAGADESGDVFEDAFKRIIPPKRPAPKPDSGR